jgi:23S rRNA pseudouridine2605 synthase
VGRLLGLPVVKIIRLRIGTLKLGSLKPRQWRHLTENEVMELKGEKVPTMEKRIARGRADRSEANSKDRPAPSDRIKRNPKDRPKRTPVDRPRTTERKPNERPAATDRPKRTSNERTRTTSRTERGRSDQTRGNTKPRTPRC